MGLRRTTLIQGPPGPPGTAESAPTSWSPGTIGNGAFVSTTVSVSGAALGFPAFAAWGAVLPDGVWLWAQVISSSSVKVYMFNSSGTSQTIASGTVFVEVFTQ